MTSLLLAGLGGAAAGFGARHLLDDNFEDEKAKKCEEEKAEEAKKYEEEKAEEAKKNTLKGMSSVMCSSLKKASCLDIPEFCTFSEKENTCNANLTASSNREEFKDSYKLFCSHFDTVESCPVMPSEVKIALDTTPTTVAEKVALSLVIMGNLGNMCTFENSQCNFDEVTSDKMKAMADKWE